MAGRILILTNLVLLCVYTRSADSKNDVALESFIQELFQVISNRQANESVPMIQGVQWAEVRGCFESELKFNVHGGGWQSYLRRNFKFPDTSPFVTSIILAELLEAHKYGSAPSLTDEQLTWAVEAMSGSLDKNSPYNSSSLSFWQTKYDKDLDVFIQDLPNWGFVIEGLKMLPQGKIEALLNTLGFEEFTQTFSYLLKDVRKKLNCAPGTPPDSDDSFSYIAVGAHLQLLQDEFPAAWKAFDGFNPNLTSAFDTLKEYAYRPFSNDSRVNTIDPKSYFIVRHFLDEAEAAGKDVVLPIVFYQFTGEQLFNKQESCTPYLTAELDTAVSANILYGITMSILSGLVDSNLLETDSGLRQLYHNTSAWIAYHIRNDFYGSYQGMAAYYSHRLYFYFAVAKTVAALDASRQEGPLPGSIMELVYQELSSALEEQATDFILSEVQSDEDGSYFDDFLGNADLTHDNQPLERHEDRIFVTASAANALMYTWLTYDNSAGKSQWKAGTPSDVKSTVDGCVRWLVKHTLDGQYDPWNVIFVAWTRGPEVEGQFYPANRYQHANGSPIEDISSIDLSTEFYIIGVEGHIPPAEYERMLKEPHFGVMTPSSFSGFNVPNISTYFWNSDSLTYATVFLAAARYKETEM